MATPLKSCLKKRIKGVPQENRSDPRQLHFGSILTLITATGDAFDLPLPEDEQTAPATDHVAIPISEPHVAAAVLVSPPAASFMPTGEAEGSLGQQGRKFSAQKVKGTIGIRKSNQRRASLLNMSFDAPPGASPEETAAAAAAATSTATSCTPAAVPAEAITTAVASEPEMRVDPRIAAVCDEAAARRAAPKPPADSTLLEGFCTVKLLRKGADYVPSKIYIRGNGVLDTFLISATKEGLAPALRKKEEAEADGADEDDVVVEYVYDKSYQVLYSTNPSIVARLARLISKSQELWTCADCIEVPCRPDSSILRTYLPGDASVQPVSMLFTFTEPEECRSFELALQPYCIVPPYSPGYLEDIERQTVSQASTSEGPPADVEPQPQPPSLLVEPAAATKAEPAAVAATAKVEATDVSAAACQLDLPRDNSASQPEERGRSPRSGRHGGGDPPNLTSGSANDAHSPSPSAADSGSAQSSSGSAAVEDDQAQSSDDTSAARARSAELLLSVPTAQVAPVSPRALRKQQKEKEKEEKRLLKESKKREKEQKKKEAREAKGTKKTKSPNKATSQYRKPSAFPGIPLRTESCASDLLVKGAVSRSRSPAPKDTDSEEPLVTVPNGDEAAEAAESTAAPPDDNSAVLANGGGEPAPDSASGGGAATAGCVADASWSKMSQPEETLSSLHDSPNDAQSGKKLSAIPGVLKTRALLK